MRKKDGDVQEKGKELGVCLGFFHSPHWDLEEL